MHFVDGKLTYSATDLSSHFECAHKTFRQLRVAKKEEVAPITSEIERRILQERGRKHEQRVLEHYQQSGLRVVDLAPPPLTESSSHEQHAATVAAMRNGADVIYQGTLVSGDWVGRPDFLIKTDQLSQLTDHCYEPLDAKLSRSEQARAILQLCVYADLLESAQGQRPEQIWLALGHEQVEPVARRTDDYFAYYQQAKAGLTEFLGESDRPEPYPEPCEHCDVCSWWKDCDTRRRKDDHLSLVAGITRRQRNKLVAEQVTSLAELAALPKDRSIKNVEDDALHKIREQAALQAKARHTKQPEYELLRDFDPGAGLETLPPPCPGDLFLDLEGDAFIQEGGLEYLFGLLELGQPEGGFGVRKTPGPANYLHWWATNREEEKAAFERLMDRIFDGLVEFPELHVFHFGHRENNALKVLSCRHGVREDQVDELLRKQVLVDLHSVVKHGLRASVESYSLKELEPFHGFQREVPLRDAAQAMQRFGWWLESRDEALDAPGLRKTLQAYNQEDCLSTWKLRDWLEAKRTELEKTLKHSLPRPVPEATEVNEKIEQRNQEVADLVSQLLRGVPKEPSTDPEHRARRLLADLLGWHWREQKSGWWDFHQGRKAPPSEWLEHRFVVADLKYEGVVDTVKRSEVHRYTFPEQDHSVRKTPTPIDVKTGKTVKMRNFGPDFIELVRETKRAGEHPPALRVGKPLSNAKHEARLFDLARSIADKGLADRSDFGAARDLLLRVPPRCGQQAGETLGREGHDHVAEIARLTLALDSSYLPIQGPPGSGKSYSGAHAILALLRDGKKVGVTANSHSVVVELLRKVVEEADSTDDLRILHMCEADRFENLPFRTGKASPQVANDLESGALNLVGGTSFAWCLEDFTGKLDVLVVDEASQMSLANALAVSTAAKNLVLLGDPAQLDQPQRGVHPPGADVSALEHVVGDETRTMPKDRGVFLEVTRRLHPDICAFTSQVFYEGRLHPLEGTSKQRVAGPAPYAGSGLRLVPIPHEGNTNHSPEEVDAVGSIVTQLLSGSYTYWDADGFSRPLVEDDLLIVAPYNAHVTALKHHLPDGVQVGTVDKFQGKERPIVIYTMATSSGEEAPRGLEFLYSLNRLNVATSRAKALVILVANPELVKARCRTPRQLQLVNAMCSYLAKASTP